MLYYLQHIQFLQGEISNFVFCFSNRIILKTCQSLVTMHQNQLSENHQDEAVMFHIDISQDLAALT